MGRVGSALGMTALVAVLLLGFPVQGPFLLLLLIVLVAVREFLALVPDSNPNWVCVLAVGTCLGARAAGITGLTASLHLSMLLLITGRIIGLKERPRTLENVLLLELLSLGWIVAGMVHSYLLMELPKGGGIATVIYALLCVHNGENGGLLFGRWLGERPLAPLLSPKKTLWGLFGQLFCSILQSILFPDIYFAVMGHGAPLPIDSRAEYAFIGLLLGVAATLGDLFQSWFKRTRNLKDMGTLLPGVGGILDRIDGLLFAFPVLHYLLWLKVTYMSS